MFVDSNNASKSFQSAWGIQELSPGPAVADRAALRQLGNRLVGILHGCLKTRTLYNENTAWAHRTDLPTTAAA